MPRCSYYAAVARTALELGVNDGMSALSVRVNALRQLLLSTPTRPTSRAGRHGTPISLAQYADLGTLPRLAPKTLPPRACALAELDILEDFLVPLF